VTTEPTETLAAIGRDALERGEAQSAREAYEAALAESETADLFEGLACALYLEGDYKRSIEAHERSFAAYREEGDSLAAARTARILSWLQLNVFGDFAVAGGWLARAERLLEATGETVPERGWVELMHATREPHGEDRERRLRSALERGRSAGDADLEFAALAHLGEVPGPCRTGFGDGARGCPQYSRSTPKTPASGCDTKPPEGALRRSSSNVPMCGGRWGLTPGGSEIAPVPASKPRERSCGPERSGDSRRAVAGVRATALPSAAGSHPRGPHGRTCRAASGSECTSAYGRCPWCSCHTARRRSAPSARGRAGP
jgi:hypothetical protein